MFILASVIHLGKSGIAKTAITEDDLDRYESAVDFGCSFRIGTTIKLLSEDCPGADVIFLQKCRESLEV